MIDEYQGIKLIAKLALDKNKGNVKQSTVAYHAGRHMLWDFIKSEHPMAQSFQNKSFLEVMQYLYPEYGQEAFDAFKIVPVDDEPSTISLECLANISVAEEVYLGSTTYLV